MSQASSPDDSLRASLRLALVQGVGPRIRQLLIEAFGSPEGVLAAPPDLLRRVQGVGNKLSERIAAARHEINVEEELELARKFKITILPDTDPTYPRLLREIPDPPPILYVDGALTPADALGIAIVGTRHATQYGLAQAKRLAGGLARAGLTIISGLARGIDSAAHRGALENGGRTLAVLGSGVLNIYPPEHKELAAEITRQGAVMSESPLRRGPLGGAFPQRNRIITGLSLGLIVVEAAQQSGALISARLAMEQGREVFAVPGRVDSRASHGCHRLIRDGAHLVETVDDVLEALGPLVEATTSQAGQAVHHPAELSLNELERQVLNAVTIDPASIDAVVSASGLPVHQVLATLSVLEMRRLVRRLSGNQVMRA